MQIKNINLSRLISGLEQIGQLDITDYKLNYAIGKNLGKVMPMLKSYNKSLVALVNKHVEMDDKGKPITIGNEYDYKTKRDRDAFIKTKTDTDEIENEVDLWKFKTSILKDIKGVNGVMNFQLGDIIDDDANILGEPEKSEGNSVPKKSEVASS